MGIFDPQGIPSSPTSKQVVTPNIAPWAQPYVSDYLTRAQQLVSQGPKPTPLMEQAASGVAGLQVPGQFAQGSNLVQQAGQGMLGTTGTALDYGAQGSQAGKTGMGYGAQGAQIGAQGIGVGQQGMGLGLIGAGYGAEATGAGQRYQQMATDPNAVGAYMNPYLQQSLAPQLAMLGQQQALAGQNIAAKAVGAGAFGGNRETLAQGLNAQNFDLARQQAIGQGYNQAFQQAQQAQQFGANLGLQGLQTGIQGTQAGMQGVGLGLQGLGTAMQGTAQGMQGAGLGIQGAQAGLQGVQGAQQGYQGATQAGAALGNLGAQQNAAQLGILGLQNQLGLQQYNLPYQQLQFAQGMLQGLPVAGGTTQGYQAGPNALSQMAGFGTALAGGYGLYKDLTRGGGSSNIGGGGGGGSYIPNPNPEMDNRDVGMDESKIITSPYYDTLTSPSVGSVDDYGNFTDFAKGGKVKSYASGGLVTLALDKAMKGSV